MELSKDMRVMYIRDPYNYDRVMTIVSKRDAAGENVSFAIAVNRPTEWKERGLGGEKDYRSFRRDVGDAFCRQKGRAIAMARLATKATSVPLNGQEPLVAILSALTDSKNTLVQRIARAELSYRPMAQAIKIVRRKLNQETWHTNFEEKKTAEVDC